MDITVTPTKPVLPDFTRWSWASLAERQWWMPLFQAASSAFQTWERLSVVQGIRTATWQVIPFDQLIAVNEWATKHGLVCYPTHQTLSGSGYAASTSTNGWL